MSFRDSLVLCLISTVICSALASFLLYTINLPHNNGGSIVTVITLLAFNAIGWHFVHRYINAVNQKIIDAIISRNRRCRVLYQVSVFHSLDYNGIPFNIPDQHPGVIFLDGNNRLFIEYEINGEYFGGHFNRIGKDLVYSGFPKDSHRYIELIVSQSAIYVLPKTKGITVFELEKEWQLIRKNLEDMHLTSR